MQHRLVAAGQIQLKHGPPVLWLAGLAWLILVIFSLTGNGAVIRHDRLLQGGPPLWLATVVFVAGWQVMLLAMMVPASVHAFSRVGGGPPAALFIGGYLAIWTLFGLLIFFFDVGVHATVNRWTWLAEHPWLIAGTTLVLAGTYKLSDLKARSLAACRRLKHVERSQGSAMAGAVHGLNCIGSSSGLMLLAFALAAGNLLTMAAITLLMVWEVTPSGSSVVKISGYALVGLGVFVLAGPMQAPVGWHP
jgi:predicted metal-binding membrane protein